MTRFIDRAHAGMVLAESLLAQRRGYALIAVPCGGVPVAAQCAKRLNLPLKVVPASRLQVPSSPRVGLGALATEAYVFNNDVAQFFGMDHGAISLSTTAAHTRLRTLLQLFEPFLPAPPQPLERALLIDDGIATGATVLAAVKALALSGYSTVEVATPVSSALGANRLEDAGIRVHAIVVDGRPAFEVASHYDCFDRVSSSVAIAELIRVNDEASVERRLVVL